MSYDLDPHLESDRKVNSIRGTHTFEHESGKAKKKDHDGSIKVNEGFKKLRRP